MHALLQACLLHAFIAITCPHVAVLHFGVFQVPELPPCSTPPTHPCSSPQSPLPRGAVSQMLQHAQQCSRPPPWTSQLNPATSAWAVTVFFRAQTFLGAGMAGAEPGC
jgi:hypothetical protein